MTNITIFETARYEVRKLEEPIPIEQKGATLFFNYEIFNKEWETVESFSQFCPYAKELAMNLTEADIELDAKALVDDEESNVSSIG